MGNLDNIKLWKKFAIAYSVIIFLPICAITYFLTDRIRTNFFSASIRSSKGVVHQLEQNIIKKLSIYPEVLATLEDDTRFKRYILSDYDIDYDAYTEYISYIQPLLMWLNYKDPNAEIRIYIDNSTIGFSRLVNNSIVDFQKQFSNDIDDIEIGNTYWVSGSRRIKIYSQEYMSVFRAFRDRTGLIKSIFAICFKEDELYDLISNEDSENRIIVYNENNEVVTATDRVSIGKNISFLDEINIDKVIDENTYVITDENGSRYIYIKQNVNDESIQINNWGIIYMIPADDVYSNINKIWQSSILLGIACIIFSIFITFLLSRNITSRISNIIRKMTAFKKGDFDVKLDVSGKDEIGILEQDFNDMTKELIQLIKNEYETSLKLKDTEIKNQKQEVEKRKAQLIALRGQINPHYLFNTLESIRMKLLLKGDRETSTIVNLFAETFRSCFDESSEFHKLEEEMQFVENYFTVQKYRYGEKLRYKKQIDDRAYDYLVPKLIIQPIIENSIYHGLGMKKELGTITISISVIENRMKIEISDDGIGMDEETLSLVYSSIYNDEKSIPSGFKGGLALRNIHKRLKLIYGDDYGLRIESELKKGTSVMFFLPIRDNQ